jgi:glucokinase
MILAGDIGGTKTLLALFDHDLHPQREEVYPSQQFSAFDSVLASFLASGPKVTIGAACLGVAGPVVEGESQTTNLPWVLDERKLADRLGTERVKLLNDLEAIAFGILHARPEEFLTLGRDGLPAPKGNMAVIAAGTGLGEAVICWDGERHHPLPSQGGLSDFAPRTDLEMELARFLRRELGHVSWESVVSGPGLWNIYRFLRDSGRGTEPEWLTERLAVSEPAPVITEVGLAGRDPLCQWALDLFATLYGAEAGNLALKAMALGGIFVAGGIAPKIFPKLADGTFMNAFADKGTMRSVLERIPVKVVQNPKIGLLGSAHYARERLLGAPAPSPDH